MTLKEIELLERCLKREYVSKFTIESDKKVIIELCKKLALNKLVYELQDLSLDKIKN